mmetsp:Transcript_40517/g.66560  ORF Transcript_40517/g.66560 Transcript_40517/m.66560 type:complete len:307 (+) Transcript_40517:50-970(+)
MQTGCGELLIKCPDLNRDCCEGPCCALLTHYQDVPHDTKKTSSQLSSLPLNTQGIFHLNLPTDLPKLGEVCDSEFPDGFQCDDFGVAGSTRCKYNGAVSPDRGYLLGDCRINPGHSGCVTDADCYKASNMCEQGVCSSKKSLLSGAFNAGSNVEKPDIIDIVPVDHGDGIAELATMQEHSTSVNGHVFRSELDLKLSVQAQIMIFGIALIMLACMAVQLRFMYKRWRWNATKSKRSVDMTDYEADMHMDMDMDIDLEMDVDMDDDVAGEAQPMVNEAEQQQNDNVQLQIEIESAAAVEQAKDANLT